MTLISVTERFPTERSAVKWFEKILWADGRRCPRCQDKKTPQASHKTMPYWCTDCGKYFSVETVTVTGVFQYQTP